MIVIVLLLVLALILGLGIFQFFSIKADPNNKNQYVCMYSSLINNAKCLVEIGEDAIILSKFMPPISTSRLSISYTSIKSIRQEHSWLGKKLVLDYSEGIIGLNTDFVDELERKISDRRK